jgi:hypothetical protein
MSNVLETLTLNELITRKNHLLHQLKKVEDKISQYENITQKENPKKIKIKVKKKE